MADETPFVLRLTSDFADTLVEKTITAEEVERLIRCRDFVLQNAIAWMVVDDDNQVWKSGTFETDGREKVTKILEIEEREGDLITEAEYTYEGKVSFTATQDSPRLTVRSMEISVDEIIEVYRALNPPETLHG
jgi:hypothetical protein